jgi:hypothetical protein
METEKFVCDIRQADVFLSSTNKTDRHDITEILLKVALITINQPGNGEILSTDTYL